MNSYKTVKNRGFDEFTEKRSRFIGYVCPVKTAEEANGFINEIRQKHWDAKHNVYAYILKDGNIKRFSDDGEPQGTAGMPVLDVLEKSGVTDVCVVVTRYFGGILLGGGGLVRAYSHSAKTALQSGKIVTMAPCSVLRARCDYSFYGKINSIIESFGCKIRATDFGEKTTVSFSVASEKEDSLKAKIFEASNGRIMPEKVGEGFEEMNL